jgi:hypothetical protein
MTSSSQTSTAATNLFFISRVLEGIEEVTVIHFSIYFPSFLIFIIVPFGIPVSPKTVAETRLVEMSFHVMPLLT